MFTSTFKAPNAIISNTVFRCPVLAAIMSAVRPTYSTRKVKRAMTELTWEFFIISRSSTFRITFLKLYIFVLNGNIFLSFFI